MKTLRLFGVVLMTMIMCFSFSACSDDDDEDTSIPTAAQLVGTTWRGTSSSWYGYYAIVTINSTSTCTVVVYDDEGDVDQTVTCSYEYDEEDGEVYASYGSGISGYIKGNKMSLTSTSLGSFVMTKQ